MQGRTLWNSKGLVLGTAKVEIPYSCQNLIGIHPYEAHVTKLLDLGSCGLGAPKRQAELSKWEAQTPPRSYGAIAFKGRTITMLGVPQF